MRGNRSVRRSGPAASEDDPCPSRQFGVRQRHPGGSTLMTAGDEVQYRIAMQFIHHREITLTRNAERTINIMCDKGIEQNLRGRWHIRNSLF
jgi:hypothetical protein